MPVRREKAARSLAGKPCPGGEGEKNQKKFTAGYTQETFLCIIRVRVGASTFFASAGSISTADGCEKKRKKFFKVLAMQ